MNPEQAKPRVSFGGWVTKIVLAVVLIFILYTWFTLTWSYSEGERAGSVQKFSKRGWVFKTWEGELAMVNLPGAATEKFYFSVRDDSVANAITRSMGQRVALNYEQHIGLPVSWFMETEYNVTGVRTIE